MMPDRPIERPRQRRVALHVSSRHKLLTTESTRGEPSMQIGVPAESTTGETRVAVTPETAKKLKAQGHVLRIQSGAGLAASATDEAYQAAGAEITDATGAFGCELVLKVRNL